MGEIGEIPLQIGSKVMVSGLQGAEYAPLNGRIGWIIGHDKQRRLRKVGGFSPAAMKTWLVGLSGCSVKTFALNGSNL